MTTHAWKTVLLLRAFSRPFRVGSCKKAFSDIKWYAPGKMFLFGFKNLDASCLMTLMVMAYGQSFYFAEIDFQKLQIPVQPRLLLRLRGSGRSGRS